MGISDYSELINKYMSLLVRPFVRVVGTIWYTFKPRLSRVGKVLTGRFDVAPNILLGGTRLNGFRTFSTNVN